MPAIIFIVVALPQPDGPRRATNSLSLISRLRSFTAINSPNFLVRFVSSIEATGSHFSLLLRSLHAVDTDERDEAEANQNKEADRRHIGPIKILEREVEDVH